MRAILRPDLPYPGGILELAVGPLEAQVKISFPGSQARPSAHHVLALTSAAFISRLLALADDEARPNRQFGGREIECLACEVGRHSVELEHDAARLDPAYPEFGNLAPHANFGSLCDTAHPKNADPTGGTADVRVIARRAASSGEP